MSLLRSACSGFLPECGNGFAEDLFWRFVRFNQTTIYEPEEFNNFIYAFVKRMTSKYYITYHLRDRLDRGFYRRGLGDGWVLIRGKKCYVERDAHDIVRSISAVSDKIAESERLRDVFAN